MFKFIGPVIDQDNPQTWQEEWLERWRNRTNRGNEAGSGGFWNSLRPFGQYADWIIQQMGATYPQIQRHIERVILPQVENDLPFIFLEDEGANAANGWFVDKNDGKVYSPDQWGLKVQGKEAVDVLQEEQQNNNLDLMEDTTSDETVDDAEEQAAKAAEEAKAAAEAAALAEWNAGDDDNDGVLNEFDNNDFVLSSFVGGDSDADKDSDGDGTPDWADPFPTDPRKGLGDAGGFGLEWTREDGSKIIIPIFGGGAREGLNVTWEDGQAKVSTGINVDGTIVEKELGSLEEVKEKINQAINEGKTTIDEVQEDIVDVWNTVFGPKEEEDNNTTVTTGGTNNNNNDDDNNNTTVTTGGTDDENEDEDKVNLAGLFGGFGAGGKGAQPELGKFQPLNIVDPVAPVSAADMYRRPQYITKSLFSEYFK